MAQKWPMYYYLFLISYEETLILCNLILGTFDACYNLHVKRIISDNSLHAILYGNHVGFAYCLHPVYLTTQTNLSSSLVD